MWSPGHMIGASCGMAVGGATDTSTTGIEGRYKSNWASIDITHSYTDVIRINNAFIKQLCLASGIDYDLHKMQLDGTSFFGWSVRAGLDRWDYIPKSDSFLKDVNASLPEGVMSYAEGQYVHVNGGNVNFIAFKDCDASDNNHAGTSNPLSDTSSLLQYGSDPSKVI